MPSASYQPALVSLVTLPLNSKSPTQNKTTTISELPLLIEKQQQKIIAKNLPALEKLDKTTSTVSDIDVIEWLKHKMVQKSNKNS